MNLDLLLYLFLFILLSLFFFFVFLYHHLGLRLLSSLPFSSRNNADFKPCLSSQPPPQVSAYGFMTADYGKYSDHYYDKHHSPVHFYANHDLRMEQKLWQQLHQAGLMQLYMRKEAQSTLNEN